MLQSRSAFRALAKNRTNSPPPSSRLGRRFLPFGRISVFSLLSSNLPLRPVELGPVDPHATQNDREFTSDRYLGLAEPRRALPPKPSRRTISGRGSAEPRLLQIDNFAASRRRTSRCDPSNRPLLAHGVYWLARRKHLRFSIAQTVPNSIVALKASAVIGPTPGGGHKPADLRTGERLGAVVSSPHRDRPWQLARPMVVALARKLLIALWRLVREGVVPDGRRSAPGRMIRVAMPVTGDLIACLRPAADRWWPVPADAAASIR